MNPEPQSETQSAALPKVSFSLCTRHYSPDNALPSQLLFTINFSDEKDLLSGGILTLTFPPMSFPWSYLSRNRLNTNSSFCISILYSTSQWMIMKNTQYTWLFCNTWLPTLTDLISNKMFSMQNRRTEPFFHN